MSQYNSNNNTTANGSLFDLQQRQQQTNHECQPQQQQQQESAVLNQQEQSTNQIATSVLVLEEEGQRQIFPSSQQQQQELQQTATNSETTVGGGGSLQQQQQDSQINNAAVVYGLVTADHGNPNNNVPAIGNDATTGATAGHSAHQEMTQEHVVNNLYQLAQQQYTMQTVHHTIATAMNNNTTANDTSNENNTNSNTTNSNAIYTQDTISEARQKMNALLLAQRQSDAAVNQAKEALQQAQAHLQQTTQTKSNVDHAVMNGAEQLADILLQEGGNNQPWNTMYAKLIEYKQEHGHCDVKRTLLPHEKSSMNPDYVKLGSWVGRTRLEARRPEGHPDKIEPYKIAALNRLGFDWQPRESYWMENYGKLKAYMDQHGRGKMPTRRKDPLGVWCDGQIHAYNKFQSGNRSYITQKKIDLLDEIGFIWDRNSNTWMQRYKSLKEFYDRKGHCCVPKDYKDQVLYRWTGKERMKYKNYLEGKKPAQTKEQWELFEKINFSTSIKKRCGMKRKRDEKKSKNGNVPAKDTVAITETNSLKDPKI